MTDNTGLPPAGWFPDPHGSGQLRWWDGTTWTEHTHAQPPQQSAFQRPDESPERALREERTIARWANVAIVVVALAGPIIAALYAPVLRTMGDLMQNPAALASMSQPSSALEPSPWFTLLSPLHTASFIVLLVWVYRAATAARRVGLPSRRGPGWAVGSWFIPIVNLWWPCQSLRDLLPPGHKTRRTITQLWILGLSAGVLAIIGVVTLFSGDSDTGIRLYVASAALQAIVMLAGRPVIDTVLAAHEEAAAASGVRAGL